MRTFATIVLFSFLMSGCIYTPKCTPPPANALDGPVDLIVQPGNMLLVINSNGDSRYCSSYVSGISLTSPAQPAYSDVIPIRYEGHDISFIAGAYLSSTGTLWLTDRVNNRVLLFDTSSSTVTSAITVGTNPSSVSPAGSPGGDQQFLVCNTSSNDVSLISSDQQKELYRIALTNNGIGVSPLNSVVTPNPISINGLPPDLYAYITRGADSNISVVSLNNHCEFNPAMPSSASAPVFNTVTTGNSATLSAIQTHNCLTQSELWTARFTPATSDFLVSGSLSGDMKTHARIGVPYTSDNGYVGFTIDNPLYPYVSGDNFTFYTTASSGLITIQNIPGSGVATATPATKDIVMTPDMKKVFVSYAGLDSVAVIYTGNNVVENYIKVGKSPDALLLTPDGSTLYVACYNSDKIYIIDTSTEEVTGIISVGNGPFSMALSADQRYLYELNYADNSLGVVDLNNQTLVDILR